MKSCRNNGDKKMYLDIFVQNKQIKLCPTSTEYKLLSLWTNYNYLKRKNTIINWITYTIRWAMKDIVRFKRHNAIYNEGFGAGVGKKPTCWCKYHKFQQQFVSECFASNVFTPEQSEKKPLLSKYLLNLKYKNNIC